MCFKLCAANKRTRFQVSHRCAAKHIFYRIFAFRLTARSYIIKDSLFYTIHFIRGGPKFCQGGPGPSPGYASACITDFISTHLISPHQHGFLRNRSCVTQLLSSLHSIGQKLDKNTQTDIL